MTKIVVITSTLPKSNEDKVPTFVRDQIVNLKTQYKDLNFYDHQGTHFAPHLVSKKIKIKSDIEQTKQTKKTCCFFKPCSITNTFWAPRARIRLKPVKNPKNKNSIYFLYSFY